MKKRHLLVMIVSAIMICMMITGCGSDEKSDESSETSVRDGSVIDYMVLVNKENKLPDGWEEALDIVKIKDSQDWDVEVEKKAYDAYLELKKDLEKEDVHVDLDSAYRSIKEQQRIVDDFTEKYGKAYTKKYVAVPGYSEHHTGLALDLYLNIDGKDIYENEDMVKYPKVWAKIHEKLADHGFILRYLQGKADITGYSYEPWHIRYIDDVEAAKEIADKGLVLEEYLDKIPESAAKVDYGDSEIYSKEDMDAAMITFKKKFEQWDGCELHSIRYAGDECNSDENIKEMNKLKKDRGYTQCIEFTTDFHSPVGKEDLKGTSWEKDKEYKDYQWWLARSEDGDWELVSWGY